MISVSAGTASVLGLKPARLGAAPTTAYLMCGKRCARDCAFCSQAKSAHGRGDLLSRVTWPDFDLDETASLIGTAYEKGEMQRACIQVVLEPGVQQRVIEAIRAIKSKSSVPLCVSANGGLEGILSLLAAGADRVSIPLDAASPEVFSRVKGSSFASTMNLLEGVARDYPGRVGTHIIAGLGETDRDLLTLARDLHFKGITIALFSFTPVKGAAMESSSPPPLERYRALQAALYLMSHGVSGEAFTFLDSGQLSSFGIEISDLRVRLSCGDAFRTSGCPGCNRPYYNESPGGPMYNYPRPLTPEETRVCIDQAIAWTSQGEPVKED